MYLMVFGDYHSKYVKLDHLNGDLDDQAYFEDGHKPEEKPGFRIMSGRTFLDCCTTTGYSMVVSKRFVDLYNQENISGLLFDPITIFTEKRKPKKVEYYLARPENFCNSFYFEEFQSNGNKVKGGKISRLPPSVAPFG